MSLYQTDYCVLEWVTVCTCVWARVVVEGVWYMTWVVRAVTQEELDELDNKLNAPGTIPDVIK